MSNIKQNTIAASIAVVAFFLIKRKKAHAAEMTIPAATPTITPTQVSDGAVMLEEDDIDGAGYRLDQEDAIDKSLDIVRKSGSIFIKFPSYEIFFPQQISGSGRISQEDDGDIILQHF